MLFSGGVGVRCQERVLWFEVELGIFIWMMILVLSWELGVLDPVISVGDFEASDGGTMG